jgi:hypothetical protein
MAHIALRFHPMMDEPWCWLSRQFDFERWCFILLEQSLFIKQGRMLALIGYFLQGPVVDWLVEDCKLKKHMNILDATNT